jgi:hypothetical protein
MTDSPPPSPPPVPFPFVPACLATGLWDAQNAVCYDPTHNHRHQRPRPDYPMLTSTEDRGSRGPGALPYLPARASPNEQARRHLMERHPIGIPPPPDRRQQVQDSYTDRTDLLDSLRGREYARDEPYSGPVDIRRPRSPLIDIFGNDENHPMYNPHAGYRPQNPSPEDDRYPPGPYAQPGDSDVPPYHHMCPGVESREIRGRPDDGSSHSRLNARSLSPFPPPPPYRPGQGGPRGGSGRAQRYGPDPSAESHQRNGPRGNRYSDWDNNDPAGRGRAQPSRGANATQQQGLPAPSHPSNAADGPREGADLFKFFFGNGMDVKPSIDRYR